MEPFQEKKSRSWSTLKTGRFWIPYCDPTGTGIPVRKTNHCIVLGVEIDEASQLPLLLLNLLGIDDSIFAISRTDPKVLQQSCPEICCCAIGDVIPGNYLKAGFQMVRYLLDLKRQFANTWRYQYLFTFPLFIYLHSTWYRTLKWQCTKFFSNFFISLIQPIWALVNRLK